MFRLAIVFRKVRPFPLGHACQGPVAEVPLSGVGSLEEADLKIARGTQLFGCIETFC
jgi:hypothetical protein